MNLGFLGAGNIGTAIITGLCTENDPLKKILVYDLDKEKCTALEQRFDQVQTATESQSLLDNVDCVFISKINDSTDTHHIIFERSVKDDF